MKIQLKYIFIYCFMISSFISFAQDRNVIWVHGFIGNDQGWRVYDNLFTTDRQMIGTRLEYSDNNDDKKGVLVAANNLLGDINSTLGAAATDPQNIAVCHSMGGLVARQIERQLQNGSQAQRFGGYVTVATPHQGAGLANSIRNGNADAFTNNACNELTAGPLNFFSIGGFTPSNICNLFENQLFQPIQTIGGVLAQQTAIDLSENSAIVNQLNTFNATSTMPKIIITGEESGNKHFRAFSSVITGTPIVENMDDQMLPNVMTTMQGVYVIGRNYHRSLSSLFAILSRFNRFSFGWAASYHNFRSTQWQRGAVWIANSENQWDAMTGCVNTSTITTTQQVYLAQHCNDNFLTGTPAWLNCIQQTCPGNGINLFNCYQTTTTTSTVVVRQPSDGIVCRDNQELAGAVTTIRAENVNHFEERNTRFRSGVLTNDDEMERAFLDVWTRTDFFGIDER